MRRISTLCLFLFFLAPTLWAQEQNLEPRILVDTPTAGTLQRGTFDLGLRLYPKGGLIFGVSVGLTNRLMFGISYGGENIVGEGKVNWNPDPGVNVRYRLLEETVVLPALVLGFDSQGYGAYIDALDRYTIKSRGFFAAASKYYSAGVTVGLHGGLNYSLEDEDGDDDLNFFTGIDLGFNQELSLLTEYDLGLNDNEAKALGSGRGYLNSGVRWMFDKNLYIQFDLKNILANKRSFRYSNREIKIFYAEHF